MKVCRRCETAKPQSDFGNKKGICKPCDRIESRARMEEYRKSEGYQAWLIDSRERRNALKAKYRIQAGCKTREQQAEERAQRMRDADKKRAEREYFNWSFIGPPSPSSALSVKDYQRWSYHNNPNVRAYQLAKRKKNVEEITHLYAREKLGMKNPPAELVEAKRLFMAIKRHIKEMTK